MIKKSNEIVNNEKELISLRKKVRELEEENSSLRAFAEIHGVIKRKEVETANCYIPMVKQCAKCGKNVE